MDLNQIIKNYKKKNRNSFEILQYLLYVDIPNLKEQFAKCNKVVDKAKLKPLLEKNKIENAKDIYTPSFNEAENTLKDILENKKATLTTLKEYKKELESISNAFADLQRIIEAFRQIDLNISSNNIDNGLQIFMVESRLSLAKDNIDLVIAKISKK